MSQRFLKRKSLFVLNLNKMLGFYAKTAVWWGELPLTLAVSGGMALRIRLQMVECCPLSFGLYQTSSGNGRI